jgi:hypothetical protein
MLSFISRMQFIRFCSLWGLTLYIAIDPECKYVRYFTGTLPSGKKANGKNNFCSRPVSQITDLGVVLLG